MMRGIFGKTSPLPSPIGREREVRAVGRLAHGKEWRGHQVLFHVPQVDVAFGALTNDGMDAPRVITDFSVVGRAAVPEDVTVEIAGLTPGGLAKGLFE